MATNRVSLIWPIYIWCKYLLEPYKSDKGNTNTLHSYWNALTKCILIIIKVWFQSAICLVLHSFRQRSLIKLKLSHFHTTTGVGLITNNDETAYRKYVSAPGAWRNSSGPIRSSQSSTDAPPRAFCQAASQPGMATALPATTWLSRGWRGQANALPGAHCLPPITSTVPGVIGRPRRSPRTSSTWATACSPCYQLADQEPEKQLLGRSAKWVPFAWHI